MAADMRSRLFKNRLYLTWADERSGRFQIYISYSTNDGTTWSQPHVISDDQWAANGNGPDDVTPTVAVSPNGVVGVSWQDRRGIANNRDYYIRFTASLDGGVSWLPSVRVSEAPNVEERNKFMPLLGYSTPATMSGEAMRIHFFDEAWDTEGDTAGLAADARGVFHPLWIDNRTGIPQMWTAPVSVAGTVTKFGDPSLDAFQDVTKRVSFDIIDASLDRTTHTVTAEYRLKNLSKVPLHDVRVRLTSITSPIARVTTPLQTYILGIPTLLPGAQTPSEHITAALSDLQPEYGETYNITTPVSFDVRIFSR